MMYILMKNTYWLSRLPSFVSFLLLDSYRKFGLTDEALLCSLVPILTVLKNTLETSVAALLNWQSEFKVSYQLFAALWMSDDVDVHKSPKWIKMKIAD